MGLLSMSKINQLFGAKMPIANVSGSVDGSNHMDLTEGESFVLTDKEVADGGNFICREGKRKINGIERDVQTVGWLSPTQKFVALGSLYKKNHAGNTNPANVGVPATSVNRADILPLLFGKTLTVGAREDISVSTFRPTEGEPKERPGTWYKFTIA